MLSVRVRGDGIAARCCEYLLRRNSQMCVAVERGSRAQVPALMLSDLALSLIRDVFQNQHLFRDAPKITRRVVAWNRGAAPVVLPHSAVVVSERELLAELPSDINGAVDEDITIHAARPLPPNVTVHEFGARTAVSDRVSLRPSAPAETCWIEAVEHGWLFLIPESRESGWLLSVGGGPSLLLADSRLIAEQIDGTPAGGKVFPSHPRIASPLFGPSWIACGTAAMAFDPICGDGTAHAVREGILATAVIQGIARGGNRDGMCRHYEARLIAGFQRHLELCREFYRTGLWRRLVGTGVGRD